MEKELIVKNTIVDFIEEFRYNEKNSGTEVPELTDEVIEKLLRSFFGLDKYREATDYFYSCIDHYIPGHHEKIDWSKGREEAMKTNEYKLYHRWSDISYMWTKCRHAVRLDEMWAEVQGKVHTDEEAAKIAADKWCELLFGWHLQDNGALDEMHGGGFPACALGTVLADRSKERITEEMKHKAHKLFCEYYMRMLHYERTSDTQDLKWLNEALPDKTGEHEWKWGFDDNMYCDYDPNWSLYLILVNSGIDDYDARSICPWKTGITIRSVDNAVIYTTYQKREEI